MSPLPQYDCAFVIGAIPMKYPTGGDKVTFQLIRNLIQNGYKIALIILDNESKRKILPMLKYKDISKILIAIVDRLPIRIQFLLPKIFMYLRGETLFYKFLSNIDIYSSSKFQAVGLKAKNLIATWWGTAYFVNLLEGKSKNIFYLIQNQEDDVSFSGDLHSHASNSYVLKLKKIVINKSLYNRFSKDNPRLMRIGIDYEKWYYAGNKEETLLIPLRTEEYKGSKYGILALKKIHSLIPNLKIIGFGNVRKIDVPGFIEYHYRPSSDSLKGLYRRAKYFVLPSLVEGFPLVNLEAMASRCAIVSTKFVGSEEYLRDGYNCILVPLRDGNVIADSILKLHNDQTLVETISKNGQLTASIFTYDTMYNDFIKILKSEGGEL